MSADQRPPGPGATQVPAPHVLPQLGPAEIRTDLHADGTATSTRLPVQSRTGADGGLGRWGGAGSPPRFEEVQARAARLVEWAAEEGDYVRRHDVALFRAEDVLGRNGFADEALYELLPALQSDVARLRLHCGRGPMWDTTRLLAHRASAAVQDYYLLWTRLRDDVRR